MLRVLGIKKNRPVSKFVFWSISTNHFIKVISKIEKKFITPFFNMSRNNYHSFTMKIFGTLIITIFYSVNYFMIGINKKNISLSFHIYF